jgi:hypothetical protein
MLEDLPVFPLETPLPRPVEMVPVEHEGEAILVVRDPLGVVEGSPALRVHPLLLVFLQLADGKTTCEQMQTRVELAGGQTLPPGIFADIARQLDELLLLQSPRFREALERRRAEFLAAPVRQSTVFRGAEGADRLEVLRELGGEFRRHLTAPGAPPASLDLPPSSVVGVLAPHIDYMRGGPAYAWAYRALLDHGRAPGTLIVLGTSHRPLSHAFVATRKAFDTPLGRVETDTDTLDAIAREFGGELFADELAHAAEHTIEMQALYLRQAFGDSAPRIVPFLVASFDSFLEDGGRPGDDPEISAFCRALRTAIATPDGRVSIIGSVDLSHCGAQFGDERENDAAREREIEEGDRAALAAMETGDPDAFFDAFRADGNARNVCSIAAIYCVMAALRGIATPRLLTYQQANSEDRTCLVSFCSVAFVRNGA